MQTIIEILRDWRFSQGVNCRCWHSLLKDGARELCRVRVH